jgi:hypothetical protein
MVLSGSKFSTYQSSIVNKKQGGGSKKAGLPPRVGVDSWSSIAFSQSGDGILNRKNLLTNRFKVFPNQNLPVGFRSQIKMH